MIPFIGLAPDLDPTTPGIIIDCENVIPTIKGMAGAPAAIDGGLPALPSPCTGAAIMTSLGNSRRIIVGTSAALRELSAGSFDDVSKVGGYTGSDETRWRFTQFGNASIACNTADKIQVSITGAFADIDQAPKARIIETAVGFVLAFGINDAAVGGDRPDAWWCSNIYDHLTWTPDPSNQAAFGYTLDTPGEIRAAKRLGQDVAVYKENSIYLGRYAGPPIQWAFPLISTEAGAVSQEAVISTGTAHYFIGADDFWAFDGSRPVPLKSPLKEWFFGYADPTYLYRVTGYYDKVQARIWWWFVPKGQTELTEAVVYNLINGKWGKVTITIQAAFDYRSAETTYDDWPLGLGMTYEEIPDIPFDSPRFDPSDKAMAIFTSDSKIKFLNGATASASITTGDMGEDMAYSTLTGVIPRFISTPSASTMVHSTKEYADDQLVERSTSVRNYGKYDADFSGRYHRLTFTMTGDFEMVGYDPKLVADGDA